jgi:cell division protein FtsW
MTSTINRPSGRRSKAEASPTRRKPGPVVAKPVTSRPEVAARATSISGFTLLLAVVIVLTLIGLVMVLSASSVMAYHHYGSPWLFLQRQIVWALLGAVALVVGVKVDYRHWRKWAKVVTVLSFVGLVAVLVPGVGITVNGSSRWLGYGQLRVQPSEIAKLGLLLFSADLLARRERFLGNWHAGLLPVMLLFGCGAALMMKQPDLGTTIVTGAVVFAVLFVSGVRLKHFATAATIATVGATVLAFSESYRRNRILAFLHPMADPSGNGYQIVQSLVGVSSGGLLGVGLGASRAKWGFLPHAHTDFIFAIIGEELGLVGATVVVALFVTFGVIGVRTSMRAPDRFGSLLAIGITAWVLVQAMVNIGAVIGVLPVTGIPLPFVSFGGSSLLVTMGATGMLLNVARQAK